MAIRRGAAALATLGICALLLASQGASAVFMSLDLVVVTDKTAYQVGDFVNATVYVLSSGLLTDARSVSLAVMAFGSWVPLENVSLSHLATGTYRGTFRMTTNLTSLWMPGLTLRSQASVGYLTDSASTDISVPAQVSVRGLLSLSVSSAVPGETVHGTLTVTYNGSLRDADGLNVSASLLTSLVLQTAYLPVTHVSTGVYRFNYTVPSSLRASASVLFWGMATIQQGNNSFGYAGQVTLPVELPDPFLIWYDAALWTTGSVRLNVWLAGPTGTPVWGAKVLLYPVAPPVSRVEPVALSATTDPTGLAAFDVRNLTFYGAGYLTFYGYATKGTSNQSFSGTAEGTLPTNASSLGLQLRRNNILDVFPPGDTAILNYTALWNGVPLNGTRFFYDVHNATTLVAYGNATASALGTLLLSFPMPSDAATVDISAQMPNTGWSPFFDTVRPEMRLAAQVGRFEVGATSRLTAQLPPGHSAWQVSVMFYPYLLSAYPDLRPEWSESPDGADVFPGMAVTVSNGSALGVDLTLPSFLPSNRNYYLEIRAQPVDTGASFAIPYVLRQLVYVRAGSAGPVNVLLVPSLVIGLGVTAVAIWVALVLRLTPRRRTPLRAREEEASPTVEPPRHARK